MRTKARPGVQANSAKKSSRQQIVLVLQGGGALGAYQVGVYQALHESGLDPDWIIGTSIGAINAALIAGSAREHRLERLDRFWEGIELPAPLPGMSQWFGAMPLLGSIGPILRGVRGFFEPSPAWMRGLGTSVGIEAAAYYSVGPLRKTLSEAVDFNQLNNGDLRLTVGAVNASSGAMRYFDSRDGSLALDHILASGALPPAFPGVRIDGEVYWDGGLFSNTPIEAVLDDHPRRDSLVFAVDMWHQRSPEPESILEVMGRVKDIQYASRSDSHIARQKQIHHLRHVIRELARHAGNRKDPAIEALADWGCSTTMHVAHLQAPRLDGENYAKDLDFSPQGIRERREAGHADTMRMLDRSPWLEPADPLAGIIEHRLA